MSSYLAGIEEPLDTIWSLGLQLVAHVTSGTLTLPALPYLGTEKETKLPWRQTWYFIAPDPCYYRAAGQDAVHWLGADCEGLAALTSEGTSVRFWASRASLDQSFEGSTPLCDTCFLHAPPEEL